MSTLGSVALVVLMLVIAFQQYGIARRQFLKSDQPRQSWRQGMRRFVVLSGGLAGALAVLAAIMVLVFSPRPYTVEAIQMFGVLLGVCVFIWAVLVGSFALMRYLVRRPK